MIDGVRVSVILPCLNEAGGLREMLSHRPEWIDEVIVVDNNSTDDTATVARTFGARVVPETTPGYGWACLRGLKEASGDVIVKLDGDGTYLLTAVRPMVETLTRERLDFVSGSRFPLQTPAAMAWPNRVGNYLLTAAANGCFGLSLGDSLSGMWAIRREAARRLSLTQGGIPFSQEIKVEAFHLAGLRAQEVAIPYHTRIGTSKLMPWRDGLGCLRYLASRRWRSLLERGGRRGALAWCAERLAVAGLLLAAICSPISLTLQEVSVGLAVAAWLVSLVAARRLPQRSPATLPILLWLLAGLLSMGQTVNLHTSLHGLRKILKVAATLFVVSEVMCTRRRVGALLWMIAAGAAVVSLDGLFQVVTGLEPLRHQAVGAAPGGLARLTATFGHANDFGVYASSILPLCLLLALQQRQPRRRGMCWALIALVGTALLLTLSRAGVLAAAAGLLAFGVIRRAWKTLAAVALVAAVGLWCLPSPLRAWAAAQGSWFDALVQPERPQMWQAAIRMFLAHPIVGVGVNTFVLNYSTYKLPTDSIVSAYAHNQYLHLLAELGLVGFAAFGWLLFRSALAWRPLLRFDDPWVRATAAAFGSSVIAFLVVGLLESALYSSHTNLYFWLSLGLLIGMSRAPHAFAAVRPIPRSP